MWLYRLSQNRRWYYTLSALIIIPGILIMLYSVATTGSPFHLSIDFQGGSIYELKFTGPGANETNIRETFDRFDSPDTIIQSIGAEADHHWSVRGKTAQDSATQNQLIAALNQLAPLDRSVLHVEQVSPTIGREVAQSAVFAVLVATIVVTGFIVVAFRAVPNAFRYGVCAILAMFHDVLVVAAAMSLFGLLFKWEVDALFLTAVLTVVGFSVQDTIVLYDRIRENIPKHIGEPFEVIVNRSLLETIQRALVLQINVFFIMIALLLFGGESIRQFVAILFVGLITGTYSSLFIAVPLLVSWEKGELPFVNRHRKQDELTAASVEA